MSRCEKHASTFNRAGFYLPFSGQNELSSQETFMHMASQYDFVPLYAQFEMEDRTVDKNLKAVPLSMADLYQHLQPPAPSCFLESLTGSDNGRYSIIAGKSLHFISTSQLDPQGIEPLRNFMDDTLVPHLEFPFFSGGLIGYWSYETGLLYQHLEADHNDFTEQAFFVPGEILVYDRQAQILTIIIWTEKAQASPAVYQEACQRMDDLLQIACHCRHKEEQAAVPGSDLSLRDNFSTNLEREEFCQLVKIAQLHINQGDIFQVVLSRRWESQSTASPWQVYRQLRQINPSPYMFYLVLPEQILMGASPEMQVKIEKGRIKSRPIAGTRKITGNHEKDQQAFQELLADEKERAEHLMLVDLSRNDIGRVSCSASVEVQEFMKLEAYSHVVHIVSTVEGELKPGVDALESFAACFPAGTLSGAPKRKAMEIIQQLENEPRGTYGGSVGYVDFNGSLDSCITIRSILYQNGTYYLQSGAGIVADSIPEREDEETYHKARVLMVAIKEAEKYNVVDD